MISKIPQQNIEHIFFFIMLDTAFYMEKLNENRFVIFIYYECRYAQFALSSTTIYLWLISLTASKDLSISLLKLYNDGAIGISDSFLDFASVIKTDNQFLIRSVRFMQVESP